MKIKYLHSHVWLSAVETYKFHQYSRPFDCAQGDKASKMFTSSIRIDVLTSNSRQVIKIIFNKIDFTFNFTT